MRYMRFVCTIDFVALIHFIRCNNRILLEIMKAVKVALTLYDVFGDADHKFQFGTARGPRREVILSSPVTQPSLLRDYVLTRVRGQLISLSKKLEIWGW